MSNSFSRLKQAVYCRLAPGTPDPEELVAEVALKLLERGRTVESANGTLIGWILVDALRKRRRYSLREVSADIAEFSLEPMPVHSGPAAVVQARRRRRRIVRAIAGLSTRIRRVIVLRLFAGMTQREIARRLDISLATVHRRLRVAKMQVTRAVSTRAKDASHTKRFISDESQQITVFSVHR